MDKKKIGIVAAIFLAVLSLFAYGQKVLAYNIVIEGEVIAQVKDAQVLEEVVENLKLQKKSELGQEVKEAVDIQLEMARADGELLVEDKDVENLVEKKVKLTTSAYALKVNDETILAMLHQDDLEKVLEEYKESFLANVDENASIEELTFVDDVQIVQEEVELDLIMEEEEVTERLFTMEEEPVIIEVQKGDSFWEIAHENDISVATLIEQNPELDPEKIWPGDKLVLKPGKPFLDVIATIKNILTEDIPYETQYQYDSSMLSKDREVIKKGENGEKKVEYLIVLKNGFQESLEIANEEILKEPVTQVVKVGTKKTLSRGVGRNYGVVQGTRVSSGYGWRIHPITGNRSFHNGVDIAASSGTGIYAYSSGTVTFAGWNGGYGNVVFIDHGNGLQTRYAHMSKIYVREGEKVSAGDKIGAVGSTGNSTGPHLHFEVRKNGSTQNPWNYI